MVNIIVESFFDKKTNAVSYVVFSKDSRAGIIIDPILDLNIENFSIKTKSADNILNFINKNNIKIYWILETHIHADHLTAAKYLKYKTGGSIAISCNVIEVQKRLVSVFNLYKNSSLDGSQFDYLIKDNDVFHAKDITIKAIQTEGHTPTCLTYIIEKNLFTGDTLLMPDFGTARTDFPGGNAATLYDSIKRIYKLDQNMSLYTCHDYGPNGRTYSWKSSLIDHIENNIHLNKNTSKSSYIKFREERDKELPLPKLFFPSIQINLNGGKLPNKESNGIRYINFPINYF
ncbi:MBL fold metallo-hydrolase [Alphaproteobacteria bacterium]|nr:MBL fold metallo-hydrolase [Alphaproteobacteria bacterium]